MLVAKEDKLDCGYCGEIQGIEYIKKYMEKNSLIKVVIKCYHCDLANTVTKTINGFYTLRKSGLNNYKNSLNSRKTRYNRKQKQLINKAIENASKQRTK